MSKPRTRSAARDRILAAADELFYYDGIATTGIDAVVERAGVALGSMYKHFHGKDDLVVAYLERRDHQWRAAWEQAIAEAVSRDERVLAIYDALDRWVDDRGYDQGCAHVAALNQLSPDHPGVAVAHRHKRHIRARLAELARQSGYRDAERVAENIAVLYEGLLATMLVTRAPADTNGARRLAQAALHERDRRTSREPTK
jgi:AcrR family transcriptional regulator